MNRVRTFVRLHPALAAAIVAMALVLRIAVPAGFMPTVDHGRIVMSICSGYGPMTMAMPGMAHHDGSGDKAQMPCAFADLALPALDSADAIQLAEAVRYILATSLVLVIALLVREATRLRPPLRGPPSQL